MNLAKLHEAIAEVIPDNPCIIWRDREYTWREVTDRTRRLAAVLRQHGLGVHQERNSLENWESGQDHVGLYLHNGNEYLEGMLGAFKARCAPFNVNYRYVEDELLYLFANADARAIIFHARFAETLARIRHRLPQVRLFLQVEDGSGAPLMEGAVDYEKALAEAEAEPMNADASGDDLCIIYTGGTTGMPKGVLWRQSDLYYSAMARSEKSTTIAEVVADIQAGLAEKKPPRGMPIAPLMHAAAQWIAFGLFFMGGVVVMQSNTERFDPDDIWSTVERHRVGSISIIGDAFAVPLLEQLDKKEYDLSSLRMISSGGAIFTAARKAEFRKRFPGLMILDVLGSSETGTQASQLIKGKAESTTGDFAPKAGSTVLSGDLTRELTAGAREQGWLARTGFVPLGYYKDEAKTRKTFPVVGGIRYSVPGDRAYRLADQTIQLLGRDSVCINTGGEKVFAEEVEHALKHHEAVHDVLVCPTPSDRWGQQVTALIRLKPEFAGKRQPPVDTLKQFSRQYIADYKVPKVVFYVDHIERAPNGKPDYRWARETAETLLNGETA